MRARRKEMRFAGRMRFAFILLSACVVHAQPYINYRGIVNSASFVPPGLSGSAIAQGSVFTIFGSGLGPTTLTQVSAFPLQTRLAGVSVKVSQGAMSVDAIPLVVTATQINAIMPSNAPLGRVSIRVTYNTDVSNPGIATVAKSSVGIFAVNSGGFGPGVFNNFIAQNNQPINSLKASANPGQVITLWGTGLGPVSADNVAPKAGNLATQVEVFVGAKPATVDYSGRAPCCAGIDQIVFRVPNGVTSGCYVPVQIRTSGTVLSNAVTIAIASSGAACSDPLNWIAAAASQGGKVGAAVLVRSTTDVDVDTSAPGETTEEYAAISLRNAVSGGAFFFNPVVSLPPIGSCTAYARSGVPSMADTADSFGGLASELDVGPSFMVTGNSSVTINRAPPVPAYVGLLGSTDVPTGMPLMLKTSGANTVSAPGGKDVGKFTVSIPAMGAIEWINRSNVNLVDRSQPLTVAWSTGNLQGDVIAVVGWNYDQPFNASWTFVCTAAGSAGSFAVPAYILSALPSSRPLVGQSFGVIELKAFPAESMAPFEATGLDTGYGFEIVATSKTVLFK